MGVTLDGGTISCPKAPEKEDKLREDGGILFSPFLLGRICCSVGKGTTGPQGPLQGAPPHSTPNYIRKTATAPGSPYSYMNSAWVL